MRAGDLARVLDDHAVEVSPLTWATGRRAFCSCTWLGPVRRRYATAVRDGNRHLAEVVLNVLDR